MKITERNSRREKRVEPPSLTAAKQRLNIADSLSGWELRELVAAFFQTAVPWEPYFTDPSYKTTSVDNNRISEGQKPGQSRLTSSKLWSIQ
ncbi:hypothetical protein Trydic_g11669 [Trypoxylus dichotomus]